MLDFAGPWGTALIAVLAGLAILFLIVRAGGDSSDLDIKGDWKAWAIALVVVFAVLFLLSNSISGMKWRSSSCESGYRRC